MPYTMDLDTALHGEYTEDEWIEKVRREHPDVIVENNYFYAGGGNPNFQYTADTEAALVAVLNAYYGGVDQFDDDAVIITPV